MFEKFRIFTNICNKKQMKGREGVKVEAQWNFQKKSDFVWIATYKNHNIYKHCTIVFVISYFITSGIFLVMITKVTPEENYPKTYM